MIKTVILDTGPLGLLTRRRGTPEVEDCWRWVESLSSAEINIIVPEIADYEIRREMIRAGLSHGLIRLDSFIAAIPDRYLPITTSAIRKAAELWAVTRNANLPTSAPHALDGDAILAGQTLSLGLLSTEFIVATENVKHISRFVVCNEWRYIQP